MFKDFLKFLSLAQTLKGENALILLIGDQRIKDCRELTGYEDRNIQCDYCGQNGYCCTSNPGKSHQNGNCDSAMLDTLKSWYDDTGDDNHMCVVPAQARGYWF